MSDHYIIIEIIGILFYVIALTVFSLKPIKAHKNQKPQKIYGFRNFK